MAFASIASRPKAMLPKLFYMTQKDWTKAVILYTGEHTNTLHCSLIVFVFVFALLLLNSVRLCAHGTSPRKTYSCRVANKHPCILGIWCYIIIYWNRPCPPKKQKPKKLLPTTKEICLLYKKKYIYILYIFDSFNGRLLLHRCICKDQHISYIWDNFSWRFLFCNTVFMLHNVPFKVIW